MRSSNILEDVAGPMDTGPGESQVRAGLCFSEVHERQRVELAKAELPRGQSSMQEIAKMLGCSEQAAFGRAFKRWTGKSPRIFRDAPFCLEPIPGQLRASAGRQPCLCEDLVSPAPRAAIPDIESRLRMDDAASGGVIDK